MNSNGNSEDSAAAARAADTDMRNLGDVHDSAGEPADDESRHRDPLDKGTIEPIEDDETVSWSPREDDEPRREPADS